MEFSIRGGRPFQFGLRFHNFNFFFKHGLNYPEMQRNIFSPLGVAKSLEIKELCLDECEINDEPEDEPSQSDQVPGSLGFRHKVGAFIN